MDALDTITSKIHEHAAREAIDAETGEITTVKPTDLAKVNLTEVALSRFGSWRESAAALVAKYKGVVFDVATTKGMQAAVAARMEVRAPRYAAQNVAKASKSELASVSKAVGAEEAEIIKFLAETEEHIDLQIRAEEERKAMVKAEAERQAAEAAAAEERRVALLREGLAVIAQYPVHAAGKPASRIEVGVKALQEMRFGEAQAEFLAEYQAARDTALATMLKMLEDAWASERAEIKLKEQIAAIEAREKELAARERALADHQALMRAEAAARAAEKAAAELAAREAENARLEAAFAAAAAEATRIDNLAKQIGEELTSPKPAADEPGGPTAADQAEVKAQVPAGASEPPACFVPIQPDMPGIPVPPTDEQAAKDEPRLIALGEVCRRIELKVSAEELAKVGFHPSAKRGTGVYFKERSLPLICRALAAHLTAVAEKLEWTAE